MQTEPHPYPGADAKWLRAHRDFIARQIRVDRQRVRECRDVEGASIARGNIEKYSRLVERIDAQLAGIAQ